MSFHPKNILVPVAIDPEDDFELARFAVSAACDIAQKYDSKLTFVSVSSITNPGGSASFDVSGKLYRTISLVLKARMSRGRMKLKELQEIAEDRGVSVEGRVIDSLERTANVICETAKTMQADLVVIGSHGRHGIRRVLLGSVAERIVHLSPVPVLLLHRPVVAHSSTESELNS